MDLNAVNIFIQVIECGSFTEAAEALKMTKSTVSRKVSELEDNLGVRLITRSTRSMILTPEGEHFYQSGIKMLDIMEKAELEVSVNQEVIKGPIKMVMPIEVGHQVVGPLIHQFLQLYPQVNINLELTNRDVDVIGEGVDLYVQIGELEDTNLVSRCATYSRRVLVASPAYLAKFGEIQKPEDIKATYKIINIDNKAVKKIKGHLENEDGSIVRLNLTSQLTVNTITAGANACIDGLGLAILPLFICEPPDIAISLIYAERKLMPKRKKLLIDYLLSHFNDSFK